MSDSLQNQLLTQEDLNRKEEEQTMCDVPQYPEDEKEEGKSTALQVIYCFRNSCISLLRIL